MERIAIVILNWNGAKMLRQYLPSVLRHSTGAAVYVADNASTDDSLRMLRSEFPQCRLIVLDRNWGFAEGYNKALRQIEAEYYLLLNSDVEVTDGWLNPLLLLMDSQSDVAACQPKLLSIADRGAFEYAGASGGFIDRYGYPYCRGRLFDTVEKDSGQYDETCDVLWASGAALMVRATDYWETGGLDARFFAHSEEIDFCWRLRLRGRRVVCVPQSHVYHLGGGTLPKSNSRKTFLNFRNNLTMLYKCLPESELRHVMRVRWWLDYVAACQMLLKGSTQDFLAVCRARRAFKQWRASFDDDRKAIQNGATLPDVPERRRYAILWQYYARRRRHYDELPQ